MYKNQLQELAQRSCFNLPSYACTREGPDHAPRFKASVNFNGEIFQSPAYCTTLRQAEHAAAEVALNKLSTRGPSRSLTARVLDETGIYKNLLQETAHRAGLKLPVYTTVRSGPGHVPVFTCTVELAGMNFTGEPAKTKKQAEKNAAIAAWSALKRNLGFFANKEAEEEQAVVTRLLSNFRPKDENNNNNNSKQFMRRRDPIQARRRMVRSSSSSSSSSSCSTSSLQNQNWRLIDLLTDLVPQVSTVQKQSTFTSLLPPPPPRTASKILLPTTMLNKDKSPSYPPLSNYRPIPVQVNARGGSQVIQPPLEEHQRDEEEWLGIGTEGASGSNSSGIFGSGSPYRQFPPSTAGKFGAFELSGPIKAAPGVKISERRTSGFHMYSGGLSPHRNIAPAVQMRSVIPVCAAPPAPVRPSSATKVMAMKGISSEAEAEAGLSLSASTNSSSSGSSKSKMPESSSSSTRQLGSEFNKLQLGGGNKDGLTQTQSSTSSMPLPQASTF